VAGLDPGLKKLVSLFSFTCPARVPKPAALVPKLSGRYRCPTDSAGAFSPVITRIRCLKPDCETPQWRDDLTSHSVTCVTSLQHLPGSKTTLSNSQVCCHYLTPAAYCFTVREGLVVDQAKKNPTHKTPGTKQQ